MLRKSKTYLLKQLLVIALVASAGCSQVVQDKIQNTDQYFDLKGLLEEQIVLLDSLRPSVEKTTHIDDEQEMQSLQLDSAGWARELEIFFEADINDPILKDAYQLKEEVLGDSLRLTSYEAIALESAEIKFLKVFYLPEADLPRYITAAFSEKNALYNSNRLLRLEFEELEDKNVLMRYSIEGAQKMLLKDTILYRVQGENNFLED